MPRRVWCQMRVCGTHTGNLNFAGTCASPRSPPVRVESPPEAVSFTFNEAGQVREITTGYPVDRRCGTTGGLGGIFGILEGLGYPLPAPLTRTCAELLSPVFDIFGLREELQDAAVMKFTEVPAADALDEERLLTLTEQLIESRLGLDDASLLREDFTLTTPHGGALRKEDYLRTASLGDITDAFPDLDYKWRDLRVCPFDVNRVWYTSSPLGTHLAELRLPTGEVLPATGRRWVSPPVCGSAQFDKDGRCIASTGRLRHGPAPGQHPRPRRRPRAEGGHRRPVPEGVAGPHALAALERGLGQGVTVHRIVHAALMSPDSCHRTECCTLQLLHHSGCTTHVAPHARIPRVGPALAKSRL
ncbi:unnamed protein product [Prorocentrum cordatum]|uniref:Uncharacterized protein n=1 Tax=Prorocentrum cordatum TaxID=2364126 RepID=A0ABN9WEN5_9DINO|nr:unnamed protein product [Polarella glacialis]